MTLFSISIELLPKIKDRYLLVSTVYEGIPADEVQNLVTSPLEDAFSSLSGMKNIESITRDNLSFLKIELHYGTNINKALIESRQIIDSININLPEFCSRPEVEIYQSDNNKLFSIAVLPKNNNLSNTKNIIENDIKHIFQTTQGINKINITGGTTPQINILVNSEYLNSKNIPLTLIADCISNTNIDYSAGFINDKENDYLVKTIGSYKSILDISETTFFCNDSIYKLKDFASVKTDESTKETFSYYNNTECIQLDIYRQTNYNPLKLSQAIKEHIKKFKNDYPNLEFIIVFDNTKEILSSIKSILLSIIISFFITFSVLFFFFKNKTISLLLTIPVFICIIFSIFCLNLLNRSINLFSLSGISISIGMLVDSSIVVIENIVKKNSTISDDERIINAIADVKKSTFNSALTTAIVFTPLLLFPGIFGELFSDLSIVVISSILLSSFLSISFIPACYKLLCTKNINTITTLNRITKKYETTLYSCILHKKAVLFISFLSLLLIIPITFIIPKELIHQNTSSVIHFTINYPEQYSLSKIQYNSQQTITSLLSNFKDIQITAHGGINSKDYIQLSNPFSNQNMVDFYIYNFSNKNSKSLFLFIQDQIPDAVIKNESDFITDAINYRTYYILSEIDQDLSVIKNNVKSFPDFNKKEYVFIPDQNKLDYYKINKADLSDFLYLYFTGIYCGTFKNNDILLDILIKPTIITDLSKIGFPKNGELIPLTSLGNFSLSEKQKVLYKYNKKASKIFISYSDDLKPFKYISLQKEKNNELFSSGFILIVVSALLLYCLLGAQFESFSLPIFLIISIFPGFLGALFFLLITGHSLNINSFLSLIIISGISINNSIILFEGLSSNNELLISNYVSLLSTRLRPILITSLTSILSLIPFIFIPSVNDSQNSLAISICGGLIASLFSSIYIFPLLIFHSNKRK